jgi:hypothetical protein
MRILITPNDIIERALWYKYEKYILEEKSQEEINKIVEENKEFELPERDALIIDLIKCIETDNLKHRLNQHILHILSVKSTEINTNKKDNLLVIRKNSIEDELNTYLKNFPDVWEPKYGYKVGFEELKEYISELLEELNKLLIHEGEFQGNKIEYVQVTHVKKMLNFNH